MITVNRLSVSRGKRRIISDVSFSVSDGEVVGVVGVNGCGKSTLLMALHNALKPDTGEVLVDGKNIAELSRREIAKQIAVVAQERDAVLPLTVRDAVGLGRLASRHLIGYGDDADQSSHLLIDEPTNHLDPRHQFALLDLISELGRTTVIVLHDLNLAARCCGQIILLDGGKVAARGTPTQVFTPQILEPIYGLKVRTVESGGRVNLLFDNRP